MLRRSLCGSDGAWRTCFLLRWRRDPILIDSGSVVRRWPLSSHHRHAISDYYHTESRSATTTPTSTPAGEAFGARIDSMSRAEGGLAQSPQVNTPVTGRANAYEVECPIYSSPPAGCGEGVIGRAVRTRTNVTPRLGDIRRAQMAVIWV